MEENPESIIDDIIKLHLSSEYSKDVAELDAYIEESLNKVTENNGNNIRTLEEFNDEELINLYNQELVERWNLAAASDILRIAILKESGGVYLDVDMLPGIQPDLFESIGKPDSITDMRWEMIKLEAIMKFKEYIPGYTSANFDMLDEELQSSFESILESKSDKSEIFSPLGELESSQLEIKIAFSSGNIINQGLVAVKDSYGSELVIKQIKNRYGILNNNLNSALDLDVDFNATMNQFIDNLTSISDSENSRFISAIGDYLKVGFAPDVRSTISL